MLLASGSKISIGQRAPPIADVCGSTVCSSPSKTPKDPPGQSSSCVRPLCTATSTVTTTMHPGGITVVTFLTLVTPVPSCTEASGYPFLDSSTMNTTATTSPFSSVSPTPSNIPTTPRPISVSSSSSSSRPPVIPTNTSTLSGSNSPVPPTLSTGSTFSARRTHPGAIAGGVVAALIAIICLFLLFRVLHRRRLAKQNNLKIEPFPFPSMFTIHRDTSSGRQSPNHGHDLSSPELCNPVPASDSQPSNRTSMPGSDTSITSSQNNKLPLHTIAQWAAEELPRQHEVLLRENEEFWEEIEQLREENERLRLREDWNRGTLQP